MLVAIFQWGWLKDLIGLDTTVPIISFLPLAMFAILFGLSMDYEVFIMSRIREDYSKTKDAKGSVLTGLSASARVITAAAIIMISVFGSFVLGDDPTIKMFGIGLAAAVFLDATVVRMIIVPAVLTLLGDRAWWFPAWLEQAHAQRRHRRREPGPPSGGAGSGLRRRDRRRRPARREGPDRGLTQRITPTPM